MAIAARRTPTVLSWRGVRQASRRFTWGLADQGMSTLTNFLLSVYVARTLGAVQFGAFSLAYVTYGFAIAASRGVSAEPNGRYRGRPHGRLGPGSGRRVSTPGAWADLQALSRDRALAWP